jgi:hypothetical protein
MCISACPGCGLTPLRGTRPGGGRKQGEDFQTNPLVLIEIGLTLLLIFVGILVIIAKAMVIAN